MAGGSSEDEAISINVTPLIDIIFCLCIFFMCSFHFKQLQGTMDSWLPIDKGTPNGALPKMPLDEIRIFVRNKGGSTEIAFGSRPCDSLDTLESLVRTEWDELGTRGKQRDSSVIIDGEPGVPWKDVVGVLDRLKRLNIARVEFAQPLPTNGAQGRG